MKYESLGGHQLECEPWSPGPLSGTIWALRPDGTPVVVSLGPVANPQPREVAYETPAPPPRKPSKTMLKIAHDVLYRDWRTSAVVAKDWYGRKYLAKESDTGLARPTRDQVAAAHQVIDLDNLYRQRIKLYRDGRGGNDAVSAARLWKWWIETPGVYREVVDLWKALPKKKKPRKTPVRRKK
jgi:hypothetical protein